MKLKELLELNHLSGADFLNVEWGFCKPSNNKWYIIQHGTKRCKDGPFDTRIEASNIMNMLPYRDDFYISKYSADEHDFINESTQFDDYDVIKIDADRDDVRDVFNHILPVLVKLSYKSLIVDKENHEKKYGPKSDDEDAYNFEFTRDALVDEVESSIKGLKRFLSEASMTEIKETIDKLKFKEPFDS